MIIKDIIEWLSTQNYDFSFDGDENLEVRGFASPEHCELGKLTWIKKRESYEKCNNNNYISVAIVQAGLNLDIPNQIICSNSKEVFFAILRHFYGQENRHLQAIGEGTVIGRSVQISEDVFIGCNCTLDGLIKIGKGTIIEHNVTIMNDVEIGSDCIIHSGTVIGKDGFGFSFDKENIPQKVPHFGGVVIGDRVEVGANCTIDRGTIDSTVIGDDTKIDNLVLIAHNVRIGSGVLVVGCTDIAGSSRIGNKSYIGPQVCIKNQSSVGNNSFVGMNVMVNEHIGDNMMIVNQDSPMITRNKNYRRFL